MCVFYLVASGPLRGATEGTGGTEGKGCGLIKVWIHRHVDIHQI